MIYVVCVMSCNVYPRPKAKPISDPFQVQLRAVKLGWTPPEARRIGRSSNMGPTIHGENERSPAPSWWLNFRWLTFLIFLGFNAFFFWACAKKFFSLFNKSTSHDGTASLSFDVSGICGWDFWPNRGCILGICWNHWVLFAMDMEKLCFA